LEVKQKKGKESIGKRRKGKGGTKRRGKVTR
jgi:hypothetical protein